MKKNKKDILPNITDENEHEYGEGKEFKNKEEALKKVEQLRNNIITSLSMNENYELLEINVVEVPNALQIVVKIKVKVPIVVEEQKE